MITVLKYEAQMHVDVVNIKYSVKEFHKMCYFSQMTENFQGIKFQSFKCNIHVGRTTAPPILFISFHLNRSIVG